SFFPSFPFPFSPSLIFVSATSNATCCTSGSRTASDVSSGSSQTAATLGCSSYENRLLAGSRTELNAALGIYGSPYAAAGANAGYANYLPYNADPSGFYTALNSQYDLKDSSPALHAGIAQPTAAAYYSYDHSFGQYDRMPPEKRPAPSRHGYMNIEKILTQLRVRRSCWPSSLK
uniref:Uncharacterized protein n=1 Tax=Pseudonaja textilis TaxID=8673 RepID=A0A670YRT6_PSETE